VTHKVHGPGRPLELSRRRLRSLWVKALIIEYVFSSAKTAIYWQITQHGACLAPAEKEVYGYKA